MRDPETHHIHHWRRPRGYTAAEAEPSASCLQEEKYVHIIFAIETLGVFRMSSGPLLINLSTTVCQNSAGGVEEAVVGVFFVLYIQMFHACYVMVQYFITPESQFAIFCVTW